MKNFQALFAFEPMRLLNEIQRQPQLWKADTYLRDYPQGPFADTETIFLRFPPASVSEIERDGRDQHECVWMDGMIALPAARELIFLLMARVQGERLGRVFINKLRPGGRVYPHADTPAHAQYYERYHFVLASSVGCNFRCDEETIHMEPGWVWWFAHALEHEVVNNSPDDRLHLIVDIHLSRPIEGLTPTKLPPAAAPTSDPVLEEPQNEVLP